MAERILQLLHNASASSANVKIKNAMNPIVKILLFILSFSGALILFGPHFWIQILGASFASLAFLVGIFAYIYFMFKHPSMLQSEEYQIQKQALEIIQQQGIPGQVELVCNPSLVSADVPHTAAIEVQGES